MKRIAVIGAILDNPQISQKPFNDVVSTYKGIVRGRMGIPFEDENMAVVSLTIVATLNEINTLTGKLGNLPHVTVKTAISGKSIGGADSTSL